MEILVDTNIGGIDVEASLPLLSEQRRERVLAMKSEEQRRQSVAAYLLLCRLLRSKTPPVFIYNEHGKPSLKDRPDIYFSMSHCRGAVAVAVGDKPVGIDIERGDRRVSDSLVRYAMNDGEIERITDNKSFLRLWTKKEALLKMTGEGIQSGLRDALTDCVDVRFTHHDNDGYICTACEKIF